MTAVPEAISKCTGRPDVAFALSVTGTPATRPEWALEDDRLPALADRHPGALARRRA